MVRILHTADWQIGKPYARVRDPDNRARMRQVRFESIRSMAELVQNHRIDVVLIAGDLFDSPGPTSADVAQSCSAIGALQVPVLVIPGNHDHGGPGSLWHQRWFQRLADELAPNLEVLLRPEPLFRSGITVLPCPLLRQAESLDPTNWVRGLDSIELGDQPRILLAHGSVHGFGAADGDDENPPPALNRLDLEALPQGLVDYVALGDWHGLKQVSSNAWYSGCPEQDRFPRGDDYLSGQVLLVELERGARPVVEVAKTGQLRWHHLCHRCNGDPDVKALKSLLQRQLASRSGEDLMLLELDGQLSLTANRLLTDLLESLEARLLRLKLRNRLRIIADESETADLTSRASDPLVARVAAALQERSKTDSDPEQVLLAQMALQELSNLCSVER